LYSSQHGQNFRLGGEKVSSQMNADLAALFATGTPPRRRIAAVTDRRPESTAQIEP
jgi:hypothetical protein